MKSTRTKKTSKQAQASLNTPQPAQAAQPAAKRGRKPRRAIAEEMDEDSSLSESAGSVSSEEPDEEETLEAEELGIETARDDEPTADVADDDGDVLDRMYSRGRKKGEQEE